MVVILSHLIVHYKKINFMEMMKTICAHMLIGVILTFLANNFNAVVGPVVLGGGVRQPTIIDASL